MRIKTIGVLVCCATLAHAATYDTLLKRYERQIQQQERQLQSLKVRLQDKEKDATHWQQKAGAAKALWSQAGISADKARHMVESIQDRLSKVKTLADAAEWSATERLLLAQSSTSQLASLATQIYEERRMPQRTAAVTVTDRMPELVAAKLCTLSETSQAEAAEAGKQVALLRTDELRWQTEEQQQSTELDRLKAKQQSHWLHWQEAQRRVSVLQEEKAQMEQSEQALHVMLQDLRDHRDHTLAARQGKPFDDKELAALRGTLPWPAYGKVSQNFGRQYSSDLNQLLVSNGIKIETGAGHTVRTVEPGKVLFANAFRQYGQLVIVEHKTGLTSVYAGLGQVSVKPGDMLSALDALGSTGDTGSFYFELRRDEQPVDPLVYLEHRSDTSLARRKFQ